MSPFSQSVADPSTFPAVLLNPSPIIPSPVIQMAIVLLRAPKNLKWPRLDSWIKCPETG